MSDDNDDGEGGHLINNFPPEIRGISGFDEVTEIDNNNDEMIESFK